MIPSFGQTRTRIARNHALLTAESVVWTPQPDWPGAEIAYLVTPDMGAKFSMGLVRCPLGLADIPPAPEGRLRFLLVQKGAARLSDGTELPPEGYACLPPGDARTLSAEAGTQLVLFEWRFCARGPVPAPVIGAIPDLPAAPLEGDERLAVQKLLPTDPAFDAEINVMRFAPGASLPHVEAHYMEHGLLFLSGGGIYRLEDDWYPVGEGDAIWMGPHAPQWFGALGREDARYLIYKNFNRAPLTER